MRKAKVLFFAANPMHTNQISLDQEIRAIQQKLMSSEYRNLLEFIPVLAVQSGDLLQSLNTYKPDVVQFSGHGSHLGEIILLNSNGVPAPINSIALKELFYSFNDIVRVVLFNSCFSTLLAQTMTEVIDCVVGMNSQISDEAAITFIASFYQAIGFNRSFKDAFNQGRTALLLEGISEVAIPQLLTKPGVDPALVFLLDEKDGERNRNLFLDDGESLVVLPTISDLSKSNMIEIEIKIDKDFKKYTKKEQKRLLRAIQELLSLDTNIRISKIRAGSVLVTLELPENYAKKLLEHIKAGKLRQFDVLDAELPSLRPMPVIADDLAKTTELLETSPQSQPKLISTSSPLQRLRLLLVERDGGTIHAVKTALENDARLEYVGYITSRSQVERQFSMDVPDVVLVDVSLVQHNVEISFEEGLAAISLITQISPATRVIGFSNFFLEHPSLVKAALQRGAAALIAKQNGPADWEAWSNWLRFQVLSVIDGYFEFSPEVARLIEEEEYVRRADLPDDPLPLTERQLEVLHLFASGLTDEEIGKKLRIVRGAVRGHISNIKDRLHLRYRWEVLEEARRRKLGQGGKK